MTIGHSFKMTSALRAATQETLRAAKSFETQKRAAKTVVTLEEALAQTSTQLQESASSVASMVATQRALEEQQARADSLEQALHNLRLEKEAAEFAIAEERRLRTDLLTAKDNVEADKRLQEMRVRDLQDHMREKDMIIPNLQRAEIEKAKLIEERQTKGTQH